MLSEDYAFKKIGEGKGGDKRCNGLGDICSIGGDLSMFEDGEDSERRKQWKV